MAISKIQYENKEKTQDDPDKPRKNKVTDEDLNEIKEIVNNNADELINAQNALIEDEKNIKQLQTDNTQNKKDISNIKTEQTEQNNRLSDLEVDNTNQKSDIKNLKEDVDELYKDNTINKQEISKLKSVLGVETEEAKSLHVENADIIGNLKIKGNIEKDGEASLSNPVYLNTLGSNADGSFKGSTEIKISNGTDTKSFVLPIQKEMLTEDYFVKESDGWKEVHNWTKIIFDGTENWTVSFNIPGSTHKGNPYFVKIEREAIYDENQYCSHCSKCSYKGEEERSFAATQNYFYFNPDDSEIASLSDLKDWLVQQNHNGTPLTAWYKCEEYKIACTDEQTTILDQLSNLDLYKGVNNITTTENIALLKLYYVTDIKSEQAQQNMNIENLQKENAELKAENERLREDLKAFPSGTAEGEYITLKDSADSRFNMFRVGGNSKQETREGYNEFDYDTINPYSLNTEKTNIDGLKAYKCIGNNTNIWALFYLNNVLEDGKAYTMCFDIWADKQTTFGNRNFYVNPLTSVKHNLSNITTSKQKLIANFTYKQDANTIIHIYPTIDETNNIYIANVMLLEGTFTLENMPNYEEYGATPSTEFPSEIQNVEGNVNVSVCNKNLFGGQWITGLYDVNGNLGNTNGVYKCFKKFLKAGTYVYSHNANITIARYVNLTSKTNLSLDAGDKKFTLEEDAEISLGFRKPDSTQWDLGENLADIEFQLEKGSVATDYVEHQEQNVLFPLAQEQKLHLGDYLASDGIHHVRKQIELDGTENLRLQNESDTFIRVYTDQYANMKEYKNHDGYTPSENFICSHFKTTNRYITDDTVIALNGQRLVITISKDIASTISEFKSYLAQQKEAGTPVILEYELVEEEIEAYTPEQQEAYNKIVQTAKSYKNVTNIYSPDPVSPIFEVNYRKDIDTILANVQAQTNMINELLSTTKTSATLLDNLQSDLESEVE